MYKEKQALENMPKKQKTRLPFIASLYSIKSKLIGVISLFIIGALSGMTFFASDFFSDHSEKSIQESNLNMVRAAAEWTEAELRYIQNESNAMLPALSKAAAPRFFKRNPEFIYLAISRDGKRFYKQIYNRKLMQLEGLSAAAIQELNRTNGDFIRNTFRGRFNFFNASTESQLILGLCQKTKFGFLLLYMLPERILRGFDVQKTLTMFMVDEKGSVIVHPDPRLLKFKSNLLREKVVKKMWQFEATTGQIRYYSEADNTSYLASFKKLPTTNYGLIAQVDRNLIFEPIRIIRNRNFIIMGIFLIIAVVSVYFFAKLISNPIISLVKAAHEVKEGHYELDIQSRSKDEVGQLTRAFRDMAKGLGEREKMKDAFGKFVNQRDCRAGIAWGSEAGGRKKKSSCFLC